MVFWQEGIEADPHKKHGHAHGHRFQAERPAHLRHKRTHLPDEPGTDHGSYGIAPVRTVFSETAVDGKQADKNREGGDARIDGGGLTFLSEKIHLGKSSPTWGQVQVKSSGGWDA